MKMANTVLLKKFKVQAVIDPGTLYAIEFGKEVENETKSYQKNVTKFSNFEEIYIGQIVAVKLENEFYSGIITDIYNRQWRPIYSVWLTSNGTNIEASADSIFLIKTPEILDKKFNAFQIIVHGIQPVTLQLVVSSISLDSHVNINTNSLDSILNKRHSNEWSPAAFKFVKDLFKTIECIYVNCIEVNGSTITGDVYFKQDGDVKLTSLAQTLCDRDLAIFFQNETPAIDDFKSVEYFNIEKKIPNLCKKMNRKELTVVKANQKKNSYSMSFSNTFSCSESDGSSNLDTDSYSKNLEDKTKRSETSSGFSSSWILKKMAKTSPSTSSGSSKSSCQAIEHPDRTVQSPKINLLGIVQRNINLNNL